MNVENLARQAISIIKSKYTIPSNGFIAGGSIANIIWELVSGNKAVINDVDIFIFDGVSDSFDKEKGYIYREVNKEYFESYNCLSYRPVDKNYYQIISTSRDGDLNYINYQAPNEDPSYIIRSFDINSTMVGYDIKSDKVYYSPEFKIFLETGELKIVNLRTPSHTTLRLVKKGDELNAKIDKLEYDILEYAIERKFSDINKFFFTDRYLKLFEKYKHAIGNRFYIAKDEGIINHVKEKYNKDIDLYALHSVNYCEFPYQPITYFSNDENIDRIYNSGEFLFYIRHIYKREHLPDTWSKLYYFFNQDINYLDREISTEDIDLLSRFAQYAPNSIENLKGYKISEQIEIIKKFLEKYKEDPIVAISILERHKIDKDIVLDDQTALLLELSVRKNIVYDINNKANKILHGEETKEEAPPVLLNF